MANYFVPNAYSPEEYSRAVELWRKLLDHPHVSQDPWCKVESDEHLYELVLSNGEMTENYRNVDVRFFEYSDYSGSCVDAANLRAAKETYGEGWINYAEDMIHSQSYAYLAVGELPIEREDYVSDSLDRLEMFVKDMYSLLDYPLLDDEKHSEYVDELAYEAWGQYLGHDTRSELEDFLIGDTGGDLEDFGFSDEQIKDWYYQFTAEQDYGPECEGATSVRFPFHDQVVARIGEHILKEWIRPAAPDPDQIPLSV